MKVLVDSDALFAAYSAVDPNHERAVSQFRLLRFQGVTCYVINLVLYEVVTVISHKLGQDVAVGFVKNLPTLNLNRIDFDAVMEEKSWKVFMNQTKKGTSFADCANVAVMREMNLDQIFSFDKFYKRVGLEMV